MNRHFIALLRCLTLSVPVAFALAIPASWAAQAPQIDQRKPISSRSAGPQDGNPMFLPAVNYANPALRAYASVAAGDLNGDGKIDLAAVGESADRTESVVQILLGNGDGTFSTGNSYFSGGNNSDSIALADINGDGKLDIIVTSACAVGDQKCTHGGFVSVLLGKGDGSFGNPTSYKPEYPPTYVAVVDMNGDGRLDLVVLGGNVSVFLGNGDGTFQSPISQSAGGSGSALAIGDLNGDGHADVAVVNISGFGSSMSTLGVLLGNGDGTLQPPVLYSLGGTTYPASVAIADLNADGKPDLVVSNQSAPLSVFLNNGDGTFQPAVPYNPESNSVAVRDVNGDGKPDVVVASYLSLSILAGNGDGTLQPAVTLDSGGNAVNSVVLADVNGDGTPDIILAGYFYPGRGSYEAEIGVMLNNTGRTHVPTSTALTLSPNPTLINHLVHYQATITSQNGEAATGVVTFADGGGNSSTVTVQNNQASVSLKYKYAGQHPITAYYSGDLNNAPSTSPTVTEGIFYASGTKVSTSGSPSVAGQAVTFTARVSQKQGANIPDGELVTFYDKSTQIGTGTTTNGIATFTTSALSVGTHLIKAVYAGDNRIMSSYGRVKQIVKP